MEHKITTERIREAAKTCGDAANVLKTLFPEAFTPEPLPIEFNQANKTFSVNGVPTAVCLRTSGKFTNKSLFLTYQFNWTIETDDQGVTVLVARQKLNY